jgi:hypothetical protein
MNISLQRAKAQVRNMNPPKGQFKKCFEKLVNFDLSAMSDMNDVRCSSFCQLTGEYCGQILHGIVLSAMAGH